MGPSGSAAHEVDLDLRHLPQHLLGDVGAEPAADATPHLAAQHEVGDPLRPRQLDQSGGEVARGMADDVRAQVRGIVQVLLQVARLVERQPLHGRRLDHGGRHAGAQRSGQGRTAVQRAPAHRPLVDDDQHPLAHRPEPSQALLGDDPLQLLVHGAGDEAQRQLTQRGQVGLGEEAVEGQPGALGRIDVAVAHPLAQGVRAHVDQLDLVRLIEKRSGRRSLTGAPMIVATASATDSRCCTLQVLMTSMPGVADELHVLPALLARRARARWCGPARR